MTLTNSSGIWLSLNLCSETEVSRASRLGLQGGARLWSERTKTKAPRSGNYSQATKACTSLGLTSSTVSQPVAFIQGKTR
jgi:hypothetical protein